MRILYGSFSFEGKEVYADQCELMRGVAESTRTPKGERFFHGQAGVGMAYDESEVGVCIYRKEDWVMGYDGRLDRREDLIQELDLNSAEEWKDEDLIFQAYTKWGDEFAKHLMGDFVIILYQKQRKEFLIIRDIVGARPFYYFHDKERFIFASELQVLLAHPKVSHQRSKLGIAQYLNVVPPDGETTFYEGIKRLPSAHQLRVLGTGDLKTFSYWQLEVKEEVGLVNKGEYAEAFREVLQRAIRDRMRKSYRMGTMLSGGLDSSSISALAQQEFLQGRCSSLHAFTWALEKDQEWPDPDERLMVEKFLRFSPMNHEYVIGRDRTYLGDDEGLWEWLVRPMSDLRHYYGGGTYALAKKKGIQTVLSGEFGDFLVTSHGHDYLWGLIFNLQWGRLIEELRAESRVYGKSVRRLIENQLIRSVRNKLDGRRFFYALEDAVPQVLEGLELDWMRRSFLEGLDGLDLRRLEKVFCPDWKNPLRAVQRYRFDLPVIQTGIENQYHLARFYGINVTFPLLDRRVLEFAISVPPEEHRGKGWRRYLMRRAMDGQMASEVVWRSDKSHTVPDVSQRIEKEIPVLLSKIEGWKKKKTITEVIDVDQFEMVLRNYQKFLQKGERWGRGIPLSRILKSVFYCLYVERYG